MGKAVAVGAALGAGSVWAESKAPKTPPQTVVAKWEELVPKDWDPGKAFRNDNPGAIREGSSGEIDLMRKMREAWDNAPVRDELDGARTRIPGYVVPLDAVDGGRVKQFLLVPYFGACIHSPPPPANQIIHVTLKSPETWRTMEAVWVSGVLSARRQDSPMGTSGYAIAADLVERYVAPAR